MLFTHGLGHILSWSIKSQILIFISMIVLLGATLIKLNWRKRAQVNQIAAHLNRKYPQLEESCELFLQHEKLTLLQRMQLNRIESVLTEIKIQSVLPNNLLVFGIKWLFVLGLITAILAIWGPQISSKKEFSFKPTEQQDKEIVTKNTEPPPNVESVRIEILPPAYTQKPRKISKDFNLSVAEGSEVNWRIKLDKSIESAKLILNNVDTLHLKEYPRRTYTLDYKATESGFYYLDLNNGQGSSTLTDFYQLEVIRDTPASVVVVSPAQRTQIKFDEPAKVDLVVEVKDDYGFDQAKIFATVTTGSGESVLFREEMLDFDGIKKKSKTFVELQKNLDLLTLGLNLGDELYFHVKVWDNRLPQSNISRSETYFVIYEDTSKAPVLVSAGIAINPIPAYFRSQRQIIIDTEKMIQEKENINESEFKIRSNNLGIDQKALRLRYGQFLGEEFDSGYGFAETFGAEAPPDPEQLGVDFLDDHNEQVNQEEEELDVLEEFGHSHDSVENATLFAESIKEQLKASLAEMWDAELKLRIHNPEEALPFEYRALVLLKRVQQKSRVFVQRVGFEPPPLEPVNKRLSGDLSKIKNVAQQIRQDKEETLPNIRRAIRVLNELTKFKQLQNQDGVKILENSGFELSQKALENPGLYLGALQNLRQIISELSQGEKICQNCVFEVERAFWRILPQTEPGPEKIQRDNSNLAKEYFKRLGL